MYQSEHCLRTHKLMSHILVGQQIIALLKSSLKCYQMRFCSNVSSCLFPLRHGYPCQNFPILYHVLLLGLDTKSLTQIKTYIQYKIKHQQTHYIYVKKHFHIILYLITRHVLMYTHHHQGHFLNQGLHRNHMLHCRLEQTSLSN
jgi:hypothetical protein